MGNAALGSLPPQQALKSFAQKPESPMAGSVSAWQPLAGRSQEAAVEAGGPQQAEAESRNRGVRAVSAIGCRGCCCDRTSLTSTGPLGLGAGREGRLAGWG